MGKFPTHFANLHHRQSPRNIHLTSNTTSTRRTVLQNAWQHYFLDRLYRQAEASHAPLRRVVRLLRLRRVLLVRRHVSTYHDYDRTDTTDDGDISVKLSEDWEFGANFQDGH